MTKLFSYKGKSLHLDPFERALSVGVEDIELELRPQCSLPWADFLLNPRRLRGSDFLMRCGQSMIQTTEEEES